MTSSITDTEAKRTRDLAVLIPIFNDWESAGMVLQKLDAALVRFDRQVSVYLVDDGSNQPVELERFSFAYKALTSLRVIHLARNLGHQRAIAVGLTYLAQHAPTSDVIVMDGDGEDDPDDVPRLLERFERLGGRVPVFAERTRRSEGLVFSLFYLLYRVLHVILTARKVRIGNFSVVPCDVVKRLTVVSELWNHYAAAVVHARIPLEMVPTRRADRLAGRTQMHFLSLVVHGLSAMSVYADVIGVRLLLASLVVMAMIVLGIAGTLVLKITTDAAISQWAVSAAGLLMVVLIQVLTMSLLFAFVSLSRRESSTFLPARDALLFVHSVRPVSLRS